MLSWTLGGYPSPNLEVIAEVGRADAPAATAVERDDAWPGAALGRLWRRRWCVPGSS